MIGKKHLLLFFTIAITWCAFILGSYIQCGVDENFAVRIEKNEFKYSFYLPLFLANVTVSYLRQGNMTVQDYNEYIVTYVLTLPFLTGVYSFLIVTAVGVLVIYVKKRDVKTAVQKPVEKIKEVK